jgi:hypothetical protein
VHTTGLRISSSSEEKDVILQQSEDYKGRRSDLNPLPVNEVVVLICGHGGRDSRCGALGLPLQTEFEDKLRRACIDVLPSRRGLERSRPSSAAHVGLTSHIGGHKWAGNVIIYIPPTWKTDEGHALSGAALWYGRVEPKHVECIVQETILGGRIIKELWRGGMKLSKTEDKSAWKPIPANIS